MSPVLIGTELKTSLRIGLTMYIEGCEWIGKGIARRLSLSHNSKENAQCVMGYIVNLTVILNGIFKAPSGNVTETSSATAT